jgi:ribosomal protein L12E/L44/L45/RPP1/RPP2
MTRDEIHKAVDAAVAGVLADCGEADPMKAAQLVGHLGTVHMCVDQLIDNAASRAAEQAPAQPAVAAPAADAPEGK